MTDLQRIQRKLDRWELDHLRELAADLAERLEDAEAQLAEATRRAEQAEDSAEFWREAVMRVEDVQLGLDVDGGIHVMKQ